MKDLKHLSGLSELREARRESRTLMLSAAFFSIFVNLLMLTGPLFMLLTYDRVLGSRSESTLVALFGIVAFLFVVMGLVDWARGRLMTRLGARFQNRLDRRVFEAIVKRSATDQTVDETTTQRQLKDLEVLQRFFASPIFLALFDMPWAPIFMAGIAIFHPWLGIMAIVGGSILITSAVLNQLFTKTAAVKSAASSYIADRYSDQIQSEAETIRSLGMQGSAFRKWAQQRDRALDQSVRAADQGAAFSNFSKTFRLFMQSTMLAVGAYLVLLGEVTPGVMIASSILFGRALAPVETVVNQWSTVQRAKLAWDSLVELLSEVSEDKVKVDLPRPDARVDVQQITIVPPGSPKAVLRTVSFNIQPGEAVGVVGPSGSGKSTLARSLTGVWPLAGGKITLGGAPLDQYHPESLSQYIGYLAQRVTLFDGTVAENIARLDESASDEKVIEAAKKAAAHEMILELSDGYNTPVRAVGTQLSGGQIQRIGLASALYGDPVVLVLDEPNSNLDNLGSIALNEAVKALKEKGGAVLIMAHRPAAIKECEKILALENGECRTFGPREEVFGKVLSNFEVIRKERKSAGGGA